MLKQSARNVLASFRPSTGTRPPHHSVARTDLVLLIRRTVRPRGYAATLHSLRLCRTACLSIPRECALAAPHVGAIGVLLCQNDFSVVCEVWNCCYRSFASVASNILILLRLLSSPASPCYHLGRSARHDGRVRKEPVWHCRSSRGEGGAARCEAAGQEKPEVYLLEYIEDCFGPSTTQMAADRSPQ